ncbi:hypothetical protein SMY46_004150 [Cronobacter turicensis]|nr:hypothetical protein [Cronobacter turicensis]ELU8455470.1 hypothetical protein [Cronobacter turicensis]ELU8456762.1 hypothetical protein [Cronobacter turicensis]ELY4112412.1 hypothetical protein [Cronobacter turicensis]ELY4215075.1 hypothetical protein [Cronobacter turicensis]
MTKIAPHRIHLRVLDHKIFSFEFLQTVSPARATAELACEKPEKKMKGILLVSFLRPPASF